MTPFIYLFNKWHVRKSSTICFRIHHTKKNTIFSFILIKEIKLNKEKKTLKIFYFWSQATKLRDSQVLFWGLGCIPYIKSNRILDKSIKPRDKLKRRRNWNETSPSLRQWQLVIGETHVLGCDVSFVLKNRNRGQ